MQPLTDAHRSYVSRRIHCPQAADDVLQEIAIAAWRAGKDDAAYVWGIVKRSVLFAQRTAGRRCKRLQPLTAEHDQTAEERELPYDSAELLDLAGQYRGAVVDWIDGRIERTDRTGFDHARRGLAMIRERVSAD